MGNGPLVAIIYHSGYGHTARIAEHVAKGVSDAGAEVKVIKAEEVDEHWDDLKAAHAIIFGSPTYMGSVSGPFKIFMDKSSKSWFGLEWKDKIAAGFTHSASPSGDKLNTLHTLSTFAGQHAMIWVGNDLLPGAPGTTGGEEGLNRIGSYAGLMTQSPAQEGADTIPELDLKTAEHFGARIATATARWHHVELAAGATIIEAVGVS